MAAGTREALRLWLQLITLTTLVEKKIRRNFKAEFETTLPRFDILANLDRAGKKVTMGELTEMLLVSKGNVTGVVASLVDQGFVRRERDRGDKRTHYLSLTEKGKTEFRRQARAHKGWIDDCFSKLEGNTLTAMVDQLAKLKDTVMEHERGAR